MLYRVGNDAGGNTSGIDGGEDDGLAEVLTIARACERVRDASSGLCLDGAFPKWDPPASIAAFSKCS